MLAVLNEDLIPIIINWTREYAGILPFVCKRFYMYKSHIQKLLITSHKKRLTNIAATRELYSIARLESVLTFCYNGHTTLLKWSQDYLKAFRKQRFIDYYNEECIKMAIKGGHIQTMIWLFDSIEFRYSSNFCSTAANYERFDILKLLLTKYVTFEYREYNCLPDLAEKGHFEILKWLIKEKHIPSTEVWMIAIGAARGGQLEILKWIVNQGYVYKSRNCMSAAAYSGKLEIIQYLDAMERNKSSSLCESAASGGHLATLKWLRQHDYAWDEHTPYNAILCANLECLVWSLENGCPWKKNMVLYRPKHYAIMKWLRENGYDYIDGTNKN